MSGGAGLAAWLLGPLGGDGGGSVCTPISRVIIVG